MLYRALGLVAAFGLGAYGIGVAPDTRGLVDERIMLMLPWAKEAWVSLMCVATAAAIATVLASEPFWRRWLANEVKRQSEGRNFRETDGEQVLRYLRNHTVWAWKQFARLNRWDVISPHHLSEFCDAARDGRVRVTGTNSHTGETLLIERRYWINGRIHPLTDERPFGVETDDGSAARYHHARYGQLAVSTTDVKETWPKASLARRVLITVYVKVKLAWYKITHDWRLRKAQEKEFRLGR